MKGIGFVEFEDPSSIPLVIRQAEVSRSDDGSGSNKLQGLVVGGRRLRVEPWKSVKKVKNKQQRRENIGSYQSQKSVDACRINLRVPTNLKGAAARKQFMRRVLQKRSKRRRIDAATDGKAAVNIAKTGKFGPTGSRKSKRKKSYSRK